ncbi:porin [Vibrio sp. 404]|uniref:Porin n=1 Tax=Vibrio marinisediminis TaxID=2758441 RepID=A0A7W2FNV0_9VIBR|nr:porin [Vibrio marinisediminis]MBA5761534.1 porin [Vibrio marinisediminis]
MKMTNIAMAVATTFLASTSAFAAQVYSGDGSTLSVGGYVDVGVGEYGTDEVKVHQVSPRLNVEGKKEIGNGVTIDAKGEWAINYLEGGDTTFKTRLGYIGATHDQAGRLVVGTQWAPYYDVAGVADKPIAFGNSFLYAPGFNQLGSARAEKMVSYRNTLNVSEDVAFKIGLGWQGEQDVDSISASTGLGAVTYTRGRTEFDTRGQVAVSAEFAGFGLGYVYNGGDVGTEKAKSHVVSANYGSYGKGLYAALVYGSNEYFFEGLEESKQYEALLAYGLDNGLNISVNYEEVEDDKTNKTQYSESAVQLEYTIASGFVAFAAYQFDLGNDLGEKEDDYWTVGARYFF